ncbi:MAG: thioredoxin domain-containing protein [Alphaproteobacteria bacterium]|nr:thioredoxin domain-containing protein [Alphaproteobacteria bacterium]MBV9373094.1 thioredoxin domain-containing protein [Alphaproteobacteria bacterium]MBV9902876.1 thioredoxin domain-containing protein [Alphaproteobacteria bacterium]
MPELRFPITGQDHVIGSADAPVTLVEYGDYQCPHCQAAWPEVEAVLRRFGRNLRYAYRHFPIATVHPLAKPAAETAEFAGAHGLFWEMHSAIYANGHQLSGPTLAALASGLGLDVAALGDALERGSYAAKVDSDLLGGIRSGVNGTPCFFVNGRRHDGPYEAAALSAAIEAARTDAESRVVGIVSE